jgi:hypothetical protein
MKFIRDPVHAVGTYRERLAVTETSDSREVIAEKLTACGALMQTDPRRRERYLAYVLARADVEDVELQSIAISALHGDNGQQSLDLLFIKLNSRHEIVRIAAITALRDRAGLNQIAGPLQEEEIAAKSRLDTYCKEQVPWMGFLRSQLCRS